MERDCNLKIICDEIVDGVPVESIILCGSRATGIGITKYSDYDILIVMKTCTVPLYLPKLKKIEKILCQNLGINITINPLPMFRIKNAKGNLFLFKVKREGITLYGKDCIGELDPGDINDIPIDKYFSFLFSAAKDLLKNFDIRFLTEDLNHEESKKIIYSASKAIIYCAELRLLMKGYYETDINYMILKSSKIESDYMLNDVDIAIRIRHRNVSITVDPIKFWYKAVDHILKTFYILTKESTSINIEYIIDKYVTAKNGDYLKNFQYFCLVLLNRKKFFWNTLTNTVSVENKIRMSLLLLLISTKTNNYNKRLIRKSYELLLDMTDVRYSNDNNILWNNIKDKIITNWPFACTVIGI